MKRACRNRIPSGDHVADVVRSGHPGPLPRLRCGPPPARVVRAVRGHAPKTTLDFCLSLISPGCFSDQTGTAAAAAPPDRPDRGYIIFALNIPEYSFRPGSRRSGQAPEGEALDLVPRRHLSPGSQGAGARWERGENPEHGTQHAPSSLPWSAARACCVALCLGGLCCRCVPFRFLPFALPPPRPAPTRCRC